MLLRWLKEEKVVVIAWSICRSLRKQVIRDSMGLGERWQARGKEYRLRFGLLTSIVNT